MAESGIYEIVNLVNGKRYVGSAVNLKQRWRQHRSDLALGRHHSRALQRAWRKYGEESFTFNVVEHCPRENLIEREQWHFDNGKRDYNCSPTAGSTLGFKHSDEMREKMRVIATQRVISPETRAKMAASARGKKKSPEAIRKSAAKRRGVKRGPLSVEHRAKIAEANRGRTFPPEFGHKISAAKTGKPRPDMRGNKFGSRKHTEAERLINSLSKKGKPKSPAARAAYIAAQTPELRALRSENMKRIWAARKAAKG